jgi:putative Holliday junction resolvase
MSRILGLDYGKRRVGAAQSDPGRTMAFPVEVYELRRPELDARHYLEMVKEDEIGRIVIGLPVHTSGREGALASAVRGFGDWLHAVTGVPVTYFDERYTTVEAEQRLIEAGMKRHRRKAVRDQLAAQIMLQGYLDAGCPEIMLPTAPLADLPGEQE